MTDPRLHDLHDPALAAPGAQLRHLPVRRHTTAAIEVLMDAVRYDTLLEVGASIVDVGDWTAEGASPEWVDGKGCVLTAASRYDTERWKREMSDLTWTPERAPVPSSYEPPF